MEPTDELLLSFDIDAAVANILKRKSPMSDSSLKFSVSDPTDDVFLSFDLESMVEKTLQRKSITPDRYPENHRDLEPTDDVLMSFDIDGVAQSSFKKRMLSPEGPMYSCSEETAQNVKSTTITNPAQSARALMTLSSNTIDRSLPASESTIRSSGNCMQGYRSIKQPLITCQQNQSSNSTMVSWRTDDLDFETHSDDLKMFNREEGGQDGPHHPLLQTNASQAPSRRHNCSSISGKSASSTLSNFFGFPHFRRGQEEVIESIMRGHDCCVFWSTGAGKSVCYLLPALLSGHVSVVVSPLISLMQDQCRGINNKANSAADYRADIACFLGSSQVNL